MKIFIASIIFVFSAQISSFAQADLPLSLEEVISRAQQQSIQSRQVAVRLMSSYWQYRSFKAKYLPQIGFQATLPSLRRSLVNQIQDDGSSKYVGQSYMRNSAGFMVSQSIPWTGGQVELGLDLDRTDNFNFGTVNYLSNPIYLNISQPIFRFNAMRWERKIEPLRYEESKKVSSEEMEGIAIQATMLFFNYYTAQLELESAQLDKINADTLYKISNGRFNVGKIAENELLQIELQVMNAEARVAQATSDLRSSGENLRNYLNIKEAVKFDLKLNDKLENLVIDKDKAIEEAYKNRTMATTHQRQRLEAERDVREAKWNNGVSLNIQANFGLTQTGTTLPEAYTNPQDQEQLSVSLYVPIADWGRRKGAREVALANQELTKLNIEQQKISFEQDILLNIERFSLMSNKVKIAEKAFEIAHKSYDIATKRYRIGKIGITDLNQAFASRDNARKSHIQALRDYWVSYYDLRYVTLYDFKADQPIDHKIATEPKK